MAHFAKIVGDTVTNVIVAEPEFFNTFTDTSPGMWLQCSFNTHGNRHPNNTPLRANFPGIGYIYDKDKDVFYAPQPFKGWVLNENTFLWEPPFEIPNDGKKYFWSEEKLTWLPSVE